MRHLSFLEKAFLRRLVECDGQIGIQGNYDHSQWDQLVSDGFAERHAASMDTNVYTVTDKGRTAIAED
jgi:hypothetical protein